MRDKATGIEISDACDYGHQTDKAVRLLTAGDGGVWLCKAHWKTEMLWRVERNKEVVNKYSVYPWPLLED